MAQGTQFVDQHFAGFQVSPVLAVMQQVVFVDQTVQVVVVPVQRIGVDPLTALLIDQHVAFHQFGHARHQMKGTPHADYGGVPVNGDHVALVIFVDQHHFGAHLDGHRIKIRFPEEGRFGKHVVVIGVVVVIDAVKGIAGAFQEGVAHHPDGTDPQRIAGIVVRVVAGVGDVQIGVKK